MQIEEAFDITIDVLGTEEVRRLEAILAKRIHVLEFIDKPKQSKAVILQSEKKALERIAIPYALRDLDVNGCPLFHINEQDWVPQNGSKLRNYRMAVDNYGWERSNTVMFDPVYDRGVGYFTINSKDIIRLDELVAGFPIAVKDEPYKPRFDIEAAKKGIKRANSIFGFLMGNFIGYCGPEQREIEDEETRVKAGIESVLFNLRKSYRFYYKEPSRARLTGSLHVIPLEEDDAGFIAGYVSILRDMTYFEPSNKD